MERYSKVPTYHGKNWTIAIYLVATNLKSISSMKLHRKLNVTQISAWYMLHKIREAVAQEGGLFYDESKVDETFVGGLELNKHGSKKQEQGRSATGKTVVVGAKEHNGKKVKAQVISD